MADDLVNVLLLRDYNTRVVVIAAALLGAAAGCVGTFLLLRKRALLADALSHATLPGVAGAFLVGSALGVTGKSLPLLLAGAAVAAIVGAACVTLLRDHTRLKEDAVLGIVLSVFFGVGVVLLNVAQQTATGSKAGLDSFIFGKAATMTASDRTLIAAASVVAVAVCLGLFKELRLLCFDADFARGQGWPTRGLDAALMALVIGVTVIGLQAVGLVLMIALLVIPPAAARFWTDRLGTMLGLSTAFGAVSCYVGATLSSVAAKLPSGPTIVLTAAAIFVASLLLGARRGLLVRWLTRRRTRDELRHGLDVIGGVA